MWSRLTEARCNRRPEDPLDQVQGIVGNRYQPEFVKKSAPHRLQARRRRELVIAMALRDDEHRDG
jgi:hypothetical protein